MTKLIKLPEVCERLGVTKSTVWRWIKECQFPAPIELSKQERRWRDTDVEQWINQRAADRAA